MKIFVLKEFKDLIDKKISLEEYNRICYNFANELEKNGWENYIFEGGVCSPDKSTFFIYNRSPYFGRLLDSGNLGIFFKNHEERNKAYKKVCKELLHTKNFIEMEW